MVDRYGRLTFEDGMNITQGIRSIRKDETEQEAFAIADALYKGKGEADLSRYKPEAVVKGTSLYWEMGTKEMQNKSAEQQLSSESMKQQIEQFKLQQIGVTEKMKVAQGLVRSGKEDAAKEVYREIFNELPNGRYVQTKDGGKLEVTNWDTSKFEMDDPTIDEYNEILGSYFNMPVEQRANAFMSGAQLRRQTNFNKISDAGKNVFVNPKTGKLAYMVPAGTWDPNGQPRGSFFVDGPTENAKELSPEQVSEYIPLQAYKSFKSGSGSGKTSAMKEYEYSLSNPGFADFRKKGNGKNTDYFSDTGKMIDDAHSYWKGVLKNTDDPTEIRTIQKKYDTDLKLIAQGKMPKYLSPDEPQSRGKVVRTGIDKDTGKKIAQYEDGTVDYIEDLTVKDNTKKIKPLKPAKEKADVIQRGNRFYKVTPDGDVEMTPEEVEEWRKSFNVLDTLFSPSGSKDMRHKGITGTHTPKNRGF